MTDAPLSNLSLIVFAYNEAENVPVVLPQILRWLDDKSLATELIFVDDGSTDGTANQARTVLAGHPSARLVSHESNRGIGAALKTGVRHASAAWITFLPCDGQIEACELDRLINQADPVFAPIVFSTYLDRNDGLFRTLCSASIRLLMRALFRVTVESDGPYLFRRELFSSEQLKPDSFFLNFEFPIRALRAGAAHGRAEIHCKPRLHGHSKSAGLKQIATVAKEMVGLRFRLPPRFLDPNP